MALILNGESGPRVIMACSAADLLTAATQSQNTPKSPYLPTGSPSYREANIQTGPSPILTGPMTGTPIRRISYMEIGSHINTTHQPARARTGP